ncbi:MAG: rRNA pseudouridine synthase [Actinobacteria bacterium]|nr:MAG: rRNA pseudouridine synthase [Actinomycetota bacterium]
MAERIRVQKAIAHAGLMSRRAAEEAISDGRVAVDGKIAVLGDRVDVEDQTVTIDGSPIPVSPERVTYLLYKPVGVVSTANDPHGRVTVVDLIDSAKRLYPVGRLDLDSEGLILVSNDGVLTERVTHPRYGVRKKYLAEVSGSPTPSEVKRLERGVELDDGPARALRVRKLGTSRGRSQLEVIMVEGRNREVRRMLEAIGYETIRLVRTAIGPIADPSLKAGDSRVLDNVEVAALMREAAE